MNKHTSMKRHGFINIVFVLSLLIPTMAFAQPVLKVRAADNQAVQAFAKTVSERGSVYFQEGITAAPETFLEENKLALGLTSLDEMREQRRSFTKIAQEEVTRFQQFHQGIPVEGAEYVLRSQGGALVTLKGRVAEGLSLDPALAMTEEEALDAALSFVEADIYAWEGPNVLSQKNVDIASLLPEGELLIVRDPQSDSDNPDYLLAWRTTVKTAQPVGHWFVYTNAITGDHVKTLSGNWEASNAINNITTLYDGAHTFSTRKRGWPYNDYILKDKTRGEITTKKFSAVSSWGWGLAGNIDQGSSLWTRPEATAHWAIQESYDYFKNAHGRSGINGSNEELRIVADSNGTYYSDNGSNSYIHFQPNFQALDVAGHEYTHGVVRHSSNLIYERESGALNESFADIFGTMTEREIVGDANYDWLMGGDFGAIRDLQNPNAFSQPDTYLGAFWWNQVGCVPSGGNDFCGVHFNSGVQNRWFSLLVDGGTENGVTVNGVGEFAARRVAYRNMTAELFSSADYDDAREGAIDAAEALYGVCSNVVAQVTNAWAAVGVGAPAGTCIPPLSAWINGPFSGQTNIFYTWTASVSGGVAPFSYQWRVNGAPVGTSSSMSRSFFASGNYSITLTVTDNAGQIRSDFHTFSVGTTGDCQFDRDCPVIME